MVEKIPMNPRAVQSFLSVDAPPDLEAFHAVCATSVSPSEFPLASDVQQKVPIYDGNRLRSDLDQADQEAQLQSEWCHCLGAGPGVFAVKQAYPDLEIIHRMSELFHRIIQDEQTEGSPRGDHFGTNERIWNALQKACERDPALCVDYYGNPFIALAAQAWLGPGYQITAQVNNVKPGSAAQAVHRDYHLGFQSPETIAQYPVHAHQASACLTLQGAVAHSEMPLASGPTCLLPFSHHWTSGYLDCHQPAFAEYFEKHHAQLELSRGDLIFFNPALFHAAGSNQTESDRLANLLQISSPWGRAMESVDRYRLMEWVHPVLSERIRSGAMTHKERLHAVAAFAEGYAFPTNLDADPPMEGHAPKTCQQWWLQALEEGWSVDRLKEWMASHAQQRLA